MADGREGERCMTQHTDDTKQYKHERDIGTVKESNVENGELCPATIYIKA